MIGFLKGKILDSSQNEVLLDVNSVGYLVETAGVTILEGIEELSLYIYTHVREQELKLFGFGTKDDLKVFQKLLSVSGVGPKSALNLIDSHGAKAIVHAIVQEDPKGVKATGIGEKTAKKIILELKSKIEDLGIAYEYHDTVPSKPSVGSGVKNEVIEALLSLGYSQGEADRVVDQLDIQKEDEVTDLVKRALAL
ncbi:Holliday junction branch migration protein RuvA [Candidatus Dojkabacteria bacterium]|uniref:Holliday junction branch migration complex subunit RuvA n=1 Tax=Candidatus Dojkabacteria bacterium TaxID=2099670 RepID=A0A955RLF0_9BACT|nr:Holliday junction branch migration protein RuvA [Candidatus Dojkabacteria bacterium]